MGADLFIVLFYIIIYTNGMSADCLAVDTFIPNSLQGYVEIDTDLSNSNLNLVINHAV